ncbi:MAG: 3-hydroxyacyl-CoA dehydrogenase NAD-binding domain-containing protein, partial [Solirubrobacteraceae bacterium]
MGERVAIVGAGLMGSQIGCEYALAGCEVSWIVRDSESAGGRVERALDLALHHGLADASAIEHARTRMT